MLNKLKLLLILGASCYAAWALGYYQGESNANEGLIALHEAGYIPEFIDSTEVSWIK